MLGIEGMDDMLDEDEQLGEEGVVISRVPLKETGTLQALLGPTT